MVRRILFTACIVLGLVAGAFAQMPTGLQADLVGQIKDAETKFLALAEAMTQEQYAWRPAEGVRSVGEVYVHIAVANINILKMIGAQPPMAVDRGMEKSVTDKTKIIEMLKKSFQHAKDVVSKVSDEDLAKAVKMFGQDATYRAVIVLVATHAHEHLGQSIAYARTNNVVPPWSRGGM